MGLFGDFRDVVRLLTEVLGLFRRLAVQDWRQDKDGSGVLPSSEKRRIATGVQAFFEKNYDLRYNVMKQTEEFRRKAPPGNSKALIGEGKALIAEEVALIENPDGLNKVGQRTDLRSKQKNECSKLSVKKLLLSRLVPLIP